MSFVEWYRKRQLAKLNLSTNSDYPGWDQVRKVGIYYELGPKSESNLRPWLDLLESEGKEVKVLAYQPVRRKNLDPKWDKPTLCKDDKNWWSMPKGEDFKHFSEQGFQLFIDFSQSEEPIHQMVALKTEAAFKLAFHSPKSAWADMVINCENGGFSQSCREEVLALLKFINA